MFLLQQATSTIESTLDSSVGDLTQETVKKVNAFQRYWASINWDQITTLIIEKVIYILFLFLLFALINKIGKALINHLYKSQISKRQTLSDSRVSTLHLLTRNAFQYTLFFFFLYSLLSVIGVPIGSLLAGAGIAGVAIGLGAQGFMNDIITGFFIILEQQMDVGDYIRLLALNIEGTVTSIGLRTTQLKSLDGTVHFIPNRNITTISNLSRSNIQVIVDIRIVPEEGIEKIQEIISALNERLAEKHKEDIQSGPTLFGMVDLGNGNFALRTTMYVLNGKQAVIKEDFLAQSVTALSSEGFTIPNTPITKP